MNPRLTLSVLAALVAGIAAGSQAMLAGRIGLGIGPVRTGLLVNTAGGSIGILVIAFLLLLEGSGRIAPVFRPAVAQGLLPLPMVLFSGFLGIVIVGGVSLGVQGIGVAAGVSALVLAQLTTGLILDATGLNAGVLVPIDLRRIIGALIVVAGVYLMLPRAS
ncbi:MAG: DMT family transporter [Spirochaetota bacterium]